MAITSNYYWPVATPGTTTPPLSSTRPPTNIPASGGYNEVVAELTGDGTATNIVLTHNFQLTVAELAQLWPECRFEPILAGSYSPYFTNKTSNTVQVNFTGTSASAFGIVRITRPQATTK